MNAGDTSGTVSISTTTTSYIITGLAPGTLYDIDVVAVNRVGGSVPAELSQRTAAATVPDAPAGLTVAEVTFNSITVNWNAPAVDGGAPIRGYQISWTDSNALDTPSTVSISISERTTNYIITGLAPGTLYDIAVVAVNRVGGSVPAKLSQRTAAATVPDAPAGLTVAEVTFNSITVNWNAPAVDGGAPIRGYQISWTDSNALDTPSTVSISISERTTSYIITGLAPGKLYDIEVVAVNRVGGSVPAKLSQRTAAATVPDAPTGLTVAEVTFNSITVNWNAPAVDGGAPIRGYQISWTDSNALDTPSTVSISISERTTNYIITGLAPGTLYDIEVVAVNRVGGSVPAKLSQRTAAATVPDAPTRLTTQSISLGYSHSCAVFYGVAKCWGRNNYGQLGDGTQTDRSSPVQVEGLTFNVTAITIGDFHSCAVQNGAAKCWGRNHSGELGYNTAPNRFSSLPREVTSLTSGVTKIASGIRSGHTCAIHNDITKCWGDDRSGQLGNGDHEFSAFTLPQRVQFLTAGVTAIAIYDSHSCAIDNGVAKCWGLNNAGQLGDENQISHFEVSGLSADITAITTGSYHSCAIDNGAAKCWGYNGNGRLGDGTDKDSRTPVQVNGLMTNVIAIAAGTSHSCAIQSSGLKCWGYNGNGQLGDGSSGVQNTPVQVSGLTADVAVIATGHLHSCAIQRGIVKCWGYNNNGQLGDGTKISQSVPVPVAGLRVFASSGPSSIVPEEKAFSASRDQLATANYGEIEARSANLESTATVPSPPRLGDSSKPTTSSITINWLPGHDGGDVITAYVISWRNKSSSSAIDTVTTRSVTADTLSYKITPLLPNTRYEITIIAVNSVGRGEALKFERLTVLPVLRLRIRVLLESMLQ